MSKSLKRVIADAEARGLQIEVLRMDDGTLTAQAAADAVGTTPAQIVKSIIFRDAATDEHVLFLTAGHNRVCPDRAAQVAGIDLAKADAASIRRVTGFAIGGVSPLGHLTPIRTYLDPDILNFDTVWAAAGTPHHLFEIAPDALQKATGATTAAFTV
ncbi:YbaK/EbsC family protein [Oceanomicrobium pacificus]|uniref:YbaK/EbsC family protein n=1 Tax=Oceanomicrobium pacificus TaxID=2692916 RepID=A0A6B0TXF3_9RHOB|nr:YbaK/EbsC family protein [Oceanomicrobium pacificus]MXU65824.1 YbaK/EbsC family protein [Oceanomicrobium pacificus]